MSTYINLKVCVRVGLSSYSYQSIGMIWSFGTSCLPDDTLNHQLHEIDWLGDMSEYLGKNSVCVTQSD